MEWEAPNGFPFRSDRHRMPWIAYSDTLSHQEPNTMRPIFSFVAIAALALAQQSRREIVNPAPTPEADSHANSDKIPDVYAISGQFDRVLVLRFKYKTDLLAGMEKMVKQEKIR